MALLGGVDPSGGTTGTTGTVGGTGSTFSKTGGGVVSQDAASQLYSCFGAQKVGDLIPGSREAKMFAGIAGADPGTAVAQANQQINAYRKKMGQPQLASDQISPATCAVIAGGNAQDAAALSDNVSVNDYLFTDADAAYNKIAFAVSTINGTSTSAATIKAIAQPAAPVVNNTNSFAQGTGAAPTPLVTAAQVTVTDPEVTSFLAGNPKLTPSATGAPPAAEDLSAFYAAFSSLGSSTLQFATLSPDTTISPQNPYIAPSGGLPQNATAFDPTKKIAPTDNMAFGWKTGDGSMAWFQVPSGLAAEFASDPTQAAKDFAQIALSGNKFLEAIAPKVTTMNIAPSWSANAAAGSTNTSASNLLLNSGSALAV